MSHLRPGVLPLILLLSGCSSLLHSTAAPLQLYVLPSPRFERVTVSADTPAGTSLSPQRSLASLRIVRPVPAPGLNTDRIALERPGNRLDYFAGSRWSGPLADVISDLELRVFRDDPLWHGVADDRASLNADYLLQTSVERFTAQYASETAAPQIIVELHCLLVRRSDGALMGSFAVSKREPVAENRMASVIDGYSGALNAALADILTQTDQLVRSAISPAAP